MQRKASARWQGSAKEGGGSLTTPSGTLNNTPYSFVARFADGKGANPEELIAAAHADALHGAFFYAQQRFTAEAIDTEAVLTMEQVNGAWTITTIHLTTRAQIPSVDSTRFIALAEEAKANCPVSRLLNATIALEAKLAS